MKKILSLIMILAIILVTGCTTGNAISAEKVSSAREPEEQTGEVELDDKFTDATVDFAVELFKRSEAEGGNVLISPVSFMLALGMTGSGANGVTLEEFEKVLGNEMSMAELNAYYRAYVKGLPNSKETKMSIANSIWFKDTDAFQINENFLTNNEMYYKADIYKAAFDRGTVKDINNWVESKTDGMIDKIIEELNPDDIMLLLNAISFDGEWVEFYEDDQVYDTEFTDYSGNKQNVEGMYCSEYTYLEDENTTGFIKHYKNGYSFVALLPDEKIAIEDYIANFTGEKYLGLVNNSVNCKVDTMIPKFSYDYSMNANSILMDMGIENAFDRNNADFSKMGLYNGGTGNLYIGSVIHKTHIEMGEKGTKAGAVTAVIMCGNAAMPEEVKEVILDRPFVYAIVDDATNIPIFIGAVNSIK